MSKENILKEAVGLTPRLYCLEDGTEFLSLIITSLAKYKPLALMAKTEKENLEFLYKDIVNQVNFLMEFCQSFVMSSKTIHEALKTNLNQKLSELDTFLNVCKELSKEGKVINTHIDLEMTEHFARLTASVSVNQETMQTMEVEACNF